MPKEVIKKRAEVKSREMKVFFNVEVPDQPFPGLTNYANLQYRPQKLADIKQSEGVKLTGIEAGADNLALHTSDDLSQGATNKYLLDLSVTKYKLAVAAVEWEKIANEAVKSNNIWTGGNIITLSAQIKEGIILNAHIGNAEIQAAKIASLNADVINTGTLTGRKVQTATSGDRISMEIGEGAYPHNLLFYISNVLTGVVKGITTGLSLYAPQTADAIYLGTGAGLHLIIGNNWIQSYKSIAFTGDQTVDGVDISAFATLYNSHIADPSAHHSQYSSGIYITPSQIVTSGLIQGGSLSITGTGAHYIAGPLYLCGSKITLGAGGGFDMLPYANNYGQVGYSSQRWDKGYFNNLYCTTQTADKHITGDLNFKFKNRIVFRIKEDPDYLNFYNSENKKIAMLDKNGNFWLKGETKRF